MHNSFILQQYVCYTTILNMFRALRCSSSGGQIVSPQPLVSSPWKSVNDHILIKWGPDKKQKEWKTIQHIAKNNNFPRCLLQKLNHQIQSKVNHIHNEKKHKIWTTFTYHSPKIRRITNLLKNTNVGIAFKATATLQQFLIPTTQIQTLPHEKSGIYKIICKTCHKSYVGQTNRNLNLRFREHVRYIKKQRPSFGLCITHT